MRETFADRGEGRLNNFDVMRFLLATAVLFGHSFTVLYGGDEHDLIYRLTQGRIYTGGLAVNAFFIISGYLITSSWISKPKIFGFLRNRTLRIFPGYIVVSLLCAFLVAWLGGASTEAIFSKHRIVDNLARTAALSTPRTDGAFAGLAYPNSLNGSLWTIRNEFLCYLLVLGLGLLGVLNQSRRSIVAALCALSLVGYGLHTKADFAGHFNAPVFGDLNQWPRLISCFLCGMTFRLYCDWIPYSSVLAVAAAAAFVFALPSPVARGIVVPSAGTYLIFFLAFSRATPGLQEFGKDGDISYGVYLYGWPIQQLCLHYIDAGMTPYMLFAVAFPFTVAAAMLSWKLIEEPMIRRKATKKPAATRSQIFIREPEAFRISLLPADARLAG